jgi:hypothetical protein
MRYQSLMFHGVQAILRNNRDVAQTNVKIISLLRPQLLAKKLENLRVERLMEG